MAPELLGQRITLQILMTKLVQHHELVFASFHPCVLIKILIQEQIKIKLSGPVVKIIETRQEINEEPRNTMRRVKSLLSKHKKSFRFIVMLGAVVTGSI